MRMWKYVYQIQALLILQFLASISPSSVDQIIKAVSKDITSIWTYNNKFPNMKSLKLDEQSLAAGTAVDGDSSKDAIRRILDSAINNKNINIFILGGSSTIGADLGENNLKLTYHYALADWWNKTIGSSTGSYMNRKVVAVGGVGTTYFGHCWQEYVNENETFDYVTWEFAINDPDSLQYDKAVERFTRDVLSMSSKPGLTFVNFASRSKVAAGHGNKCKRHEDDAKIVDLMAKHYGSTSIRWERALCKLKMQKNLDELFKKNHPKVLGHAQVAYMLINQFKQVILNALSKFGRRDKIVQPFLPYVPPGTVLDTRTDLYPSTVVTSNLPEPVFMTKADSSSMSKCFTSITPGPSIPQKHKLQNLHIIQNNGFTVLDETPWEVPEVREDSTGGYITQKPNNSLKLQFEVSHSMGASVLSQISVTIRRKYFGGRVKFVLNEGTGNEKIVHGDTSEKTRAGTSTIEIGVSTTGMQTLSIYTETGGCNLCAIIID